MLHCPLCCTAGNADDDEFGFETPRYRIETSLHIIRSVDVRHCVLFTFSSFALRVFCM